MNSTRITLLERVRDRSDERAWAEFFALYAPLLYRYARARGLAHDDAQEVRDRCLATLARRMPDFDYDARRGRFKSWLHRIVRDAVVDLLRQRARRPAGERLPTERWRLLPDDADGPDALWEKAWRHEHLLAALEQVRASVSPVQDQAFRMLLLDGASVAEVAAALGLNANQVHKARARVLAAVRRRLRGLAVLD